MLTRRQSVPFMFVGVCSGRDCTRSRVHLPAEPPIRTWVNLTAKCLHGARKTVPFQSRVDLAADRPYVHG